MYWKTTPFDAEAVMSGKKKKKRRRCRLYDWTGRFQRSVEVAVNEMKTARGERSSMQNRGQSVALGHWAIWKSHAPSSNQ